MKIAVFAFFLLLVGHSLGQEQQIVRGEKNGLPVYVHSIVEGNTVYGLLADYGVSKEELLKFNPTLQDELSVGQKVYIPIVRETVNHEVKAKETLFSLSKKYGVPIDTILSANKSLSDGLKIGQTIKIPGVERLIQHQLNGNNAGSNHSANNSITQGNNQLVSQDSIIEYTVRENETIYTISKRFMVSVEEIQKLNNLKSMKILPGNRLKIPVREPGNDNVAVREIVDESPTTKDSNLIFPIKERYKVALLLPFFLDKGETNTDYLSNLAAEFYMGAQLALDSLENRGLRAKVYVFDVRNDTLTLKKVLSRPEMKDIDLVVGPLNAEGVDLVAKWCKRNQIRMVCPVAINATVLKNNPYVYSAIPSDATLMKKLAEHLMNNSNSDQLILVKSPIEKDNVLYDSFRSNFLKLAAQKGESMKVIEATLENYTTFIRKGNRVVIVVPTNEKVTAVKFMNSLNEASAKLDAELISIYGTKEWMNMDEIKASFRNKFHFHFSSPNDLNYSYETTATLLKKYRTKYRADLSKIAVQGYDVFAYFCSLLMLEDKSIPLVMNNFNLVQLGNTNGFENEHAFVLKQSDFELKNADTKE